MRKRLIRILLAGCAAAAAVALCGSQAFAAGGTVSITNANTSFTATNDGPVVITDITDGLTITCSTFTFTGSISNVTNAPLPYTVLANGGANSGAITGFANITCTSSFGKISVTTYPPFDLVITGSNGNNQAVGVMQSHAGANVDMFLVTVLTCSFGISGSAPFTWVNGSIDQLRFSPYAGPPNTLTADSVSGGCLGQISTGAVLQFTGNFTVTPNITIP